MDCISSAEMRGVLQNVQGPRPSLMQMTFPHERQFGAAAKTSCFKPMQLHFRRSVCMVGFVLTSRARRADSRSLSSLLTPRMEVPPVTTTFCCCGFAFFVFTLMRSEVSVPGAFEFDEGVIIGWDETVGNCFASEVVSIGLSGSFGVGTRLLLLDFPV